MNEKERQKKCVRGMSFCTKSGVALTHHHGDFLKLWQLWALLLLCACQNSFAVNVYMNLYYLCTNCCYS